MKTDFVKKSILLLLCVLFTFTFVFVAASAAKPGAAQTLGAVAKGLIEEKSKIKIISVSDRGDETDGDACPYPTRDLFEPAVEEFCGTPNGKLTGANEELPSNKTTPSS
ncbi:MAG: hypothetical protein IJI14_20965 [Anaerolineaceae bacterium]|nr:hypothetical protein [Anaerolineaceae bacterium]